MPDSVSVSYSLEMVEGKQYLMHCDIVNVAPASRLFVYWYKNNKMIYSEAFNRSEPSPVNKTSNLTLTAHRDDDGAKIWCEMKLDLLTVTENIRKKSSESQVIVLCEFFFHYHCHIYIGSKCKNVSIDTICVKPELNL